jgi:PBP1b-binding outer membrane lipoprotein LpoB
MTKSKIAALLATLALGAFAAGCSTVVVNENANANMTKPVNTSKPANLAPPANTSAKPPANTNTKTTPPKASPTKKP